MCTPGLQSPRRREGRQQCHATPGARIGPGRRALGTTTTVGESGGWGWAHFSTSSMALTWSSSSVRPASLHMSLMPCAARHKHNDADIHDSYANGQIKTTPMGGQLFCAFILEVYPAMHPGSTRIHKNSKFERDCVFSDAKSSHSSLAKHLGPGFQCTVGITLNFDKRVQRDF